MAIPQTEKTHVSASGFDLRTPHDALDILATAQMSAAWAVRSALGALARASELTAETIASGGQLAYAAAGSSALMAMADALELPGTYGIPKDKIHILIAGGAGALGNLAGAPEDDEAQAASDVADAGLGRGDCLLAISASGSTPYALEAARVARARGATVIGIANNAGAALFAVADLAVCLPTPPEVIAGSTRMGAGTAQKIALNLISTMMATRLGHVHDGFMVNLVADNRKLRERARGIVMAVSRCSEAEASEWLGAADGSVKVAILLAAGAAGPQQARDLLEETRGRLRPALATLHDPASGPSPGEPPTEPTPD